MEACRMRNTPIITFINKLDRDGMLPLEVLADIENKLQYECFHCMAVCPACVDA